MAIYIDLNCHHCCLVRPKLCAVKLFARFTAQLTHCFEMTCNYPTSNTWCNCRWRGVHWTLPARVLHSFVYIDICHHPYINRLRIVGGFVCYIHHQAQQYTMKSDGFGSLQHFPIIISVTTGAERGVFGIGGQTGCARGRRHVMSDDARTALGLSMLWRAMSIHIYTKCISSQRTVIAWFIGLWAWRRQRPPFDWQIDFELDLSRVTPASRCVCTMGI